MTLGEVQKYIESKKHGNETFMYMGHDANLFTKEQLIILFNINHKIEQRMLDQARKERDMFAKI